MTMREKIARALIERRYPGAMSESLAVNGLTIVPPDIYHAALADVDTALDELLVPTEAMIEQVKNGNTPLGGYGFGDDCYQCDPEEVFAAMIQAAKENK